MKERECSHCTKIKPLTKDFFEPDVRYKEGFTRRCLDCKKKYNANYQTQDRNKRPEFFKAREFAREMKKYGTTVEWYRDRLIEQCGVCALCKHLSHHHGTIQRLQVDHNHDCCDLKTKSCGRCLRGLLCADCNILLSYLEKFLKQTITVVPKWDTWLENAMLYLKKYRRTQQCS